MHLRARNVMSRQVKCRKICSLPSCEPATKRSFAATATAKRSESAVKAASGFPVSRSQSLSVKRTARGGHSAAPPPPYLALRWPAQKASYFEGVVTLLKIGCGFVGIRCYNHAAATTSRHVCRGEASARIASEVPCPTIHHQTKKP